MATPKYNIASIWCLQSGFTYLCLNRGRPPMIQTQACIPKHSFFSPRNPGGRVATTRNNWVSPDGCFHCEIPGPGFLEIFENNRKQTHIFLGVFFFFGQQPARIVFVFILFIFCFDQPSRRQWRWRKCHGWKTTITFTGDGAAFMTSMAKMAVNMWWDMEGA